MGEQSLAKREGLAAVIALGALVAGALYICAWSLIVGKIGIGTAGARPAILFRSQTPFLFWLVWGFWAFFTSALTYFTAHAIREVWELWRSKGGRK
jgi:hypothetical protein